MSDRRCALSTLATSRCPETSSGRWPSLLSRSSCRSQQGHLPNPFRSSSAYTPLHSPRNHPSAGPDTHGLDVCARSRVIVSNHAAKAALRERQGTHEAAHRVVSHVPSAPPELRVMMSIPNIFNPNLNGMEPIPDFLPSPNETVGFKCAPRLPRPDCPMHRACPSRNAMPARRARSISPRPSTRARVPRGFVSSACRHPYELAATRSTGSSARAPSAPSSAPCTKAPRTGPWHSSASRTQRRRWMPGWARPGFNL